MKNEIEENKNKNLILLNYETIETISKPNFYNSKFQSLNFEDIIKIPKNINPTTRKFVNKKEFDVEKYSYCLKAILYLQIDPSFENNDFLKTHLFLKNCGIKREKTLPNRYFISFKIIDYEGPNHEFEVEEAKDLPLCRPGEEFEVLNFLSEQKQTFVKSVQGLWNMTNIFMLGISNNDVKKFVGRSTMHQKLKKPKDFTQITKPTLPKYPHTEFQADWIDYRVHPSGNAHYKYILTLIDCFSKYCWAFPSTSNDSKGDLSSTDPKSTQHSIWKIKDPLTNLTLEQVLMQERQLALKCYALEGNVDQPKDKVKKCKMRTDNGFSQDFGIALNQLGFVHLKGLPYHPWVQGQAERMNRTIKSYLLSSQIFVQKHEKHFSWNEHLEVILYNYNNVNLHSVTGFKPSKLHFLNEEVGETSGIYQSVRNNMYNRASKLVWGNKQQLQNIFEPGDVVLMMKNDTHLKNPMVKKTSVTWWDDNNYYIINSCQQINPVLGPMYSLRKTKEVTTSSHAIIEPDFDQPLIQNIPGKYLTLTTLPNPKTLEKDEKKEVKKENIQDIKPFKLEEPLSSSSTIPHDTSDSESDSTDSDSETEENDEPNKVILQLLKEKEKENDVTLAQPNATNKEIQDIPEEKDIKNVELIVTKKENIHAWEDPDERIKPGHMIGSSDCERLLRIFRELSPFAQKDNWILYPICVDYFVDEEKTKEGHQYADGTFLNVIQALKTDYDKLLLLVDKEKQKDKQLTCNLVFCIAGLGHFVAVQLIFDGFVLISFIIDSIPRSLLAEYVSKRIHDEKTKRELNIIDDVNIPKTTIIETNWQNNPSFRKNAKRDKVDNYIRWSNQSCGIFAAYSAFRMVKKQITGDIFVGNVEQPTGEDLFMWRLCAVKGLELTRKVLQEIKDKKDIKDK